jgi:Tfp pilus assembly protein PilN
MSTATASRFTIGGKKATKGVVVGGRIPGAPLLPQVNLLPNSVRARRALQRTKLWLLVALGAVVILVLLGYVAAMLSARAAQEEVDAVQATTTRLQQEQTKYSEVPQVLAQIRGVESARDVATSTEVLWAAVLVEVLAALPEGAALMSFDTEVVNPLMAPTLPADPLTTPGIGAVTITHRSLTLPDTSAWVEALNEIPGLQDAQFTTASIAEEDGQVYYEVSTVLEVSPEKLANRFSESEEKE